MRQARQDDRRVGRPRCDHELQRRRQTIPARYQYDDGKLIHVPALALTNDYLFNPEPMSSPPDPQSKAAGYDQVVKAGYDSMQVAFRGATHLTYTYVPYVLPASELAERFASYYTVAWFNRYLKGDDSGFKRLTATKFDSSADTDSIGAGLYDPQAGAGGPDQPRRPGTCRTRSRGSRSTTSCRSTTCRSTRWTNPRGASRSPASTCARAARRWRPRLRRAWRQRGHIVGRRHGRRPTHARHRRAHRSRQDGPDPGADRSRHRPAARGARTGISIELGYASLELAVRSPRCR